MEAYDVKALMEKLKARGLSVAEDTASGVISDVFGWLKDSAAASPNQVDDMIAPLLVPLEAYIKVQVDKIDGEVG